MGKRNISRQSQGDASLACKHLACSTRCSALCRCCSSKRRNQQRPKLSRLSGSKSFRKSITQKKYMTYVYDPGSRFATTPPPPHMVWSQNLRFAAFRMKTLYLQCFLHGGLLARSATLQIRWIFATNLPKTCYLQCFGFDIVE